MIWIGEKSKASPTQAIEIEEAKDSEEKIKSQQTNQSVLTKRIIKRYRGQVYVNSIF